jgi:hypothetical protein
MPYATQPHASGRQGHKSAAYNQAVAEVRQRAQAGEVCWFYQIRPECHGMWDWSLDSNDGWAFTAHHLDRLMDGGPPVPDPRLMVPAHRGCNAWDGLRAQNARRQGLHLSTTDMIPVRTTYRSRDW